VCGDAVRDWCGTGAVWERRGPELRGEDERGRGQGGAQRGNRPHGWAKMRREAGRGAGKMGICRG